MRGVLLSAYQCGPGMGSVSQIGWEWYSRLSREVPVTLMTHIRNRAALTAAGAPLPGSFVHYIDTEWFAGPLYRTASAIFPRSQHATFLLASLDYFPYDSGVLKLARQLMKTEAWDLVHVPTPVSPSGATRIHKLGLPVVLGPWNGGLNSPAGFPDIMRDDAGWTYKLREVGRSLDRWFGTTASASLILSATTATDASIRPENRSRAVRMIENGVNTTLFHPLPDKPRSETLRLVFTGRLVPFKGVGMLLGAITQIRNEFPVELEIIGEGPLRADLEAQSQSLGLSSIVRFTGNLPLPEVAARMRAADVFCLPSVRESGGAVVLEAMASGIPVLAVNYGGPAEIVREDFGRLLRADDKTALVEDLLTALREVHSNPELWHAKGLAGRAAAEQLYTWDAKIATALQLYRSVINKEPLHA